MKEEGFLRDQSSLLSETSFQNGSSDPLKENKGNSRFGRPLGTALEFAPFLKLKESFQGNVHTPFRQSSTKGRFFIVEGVVP